MMAPTRSKGGPATLADMSRDDHARLRADGQHRRSAAAGGAREENAPASVAASASARPTRTNVVRSA